MNSNTKAGVFWAVLTLVAVFLGLLVAFGRDHAGAGISKHPNYVGTGIFFLASYIIYLVLSRPTKRNAILGGLPMVLGYLVWLILLRY
ncbi:membrane hypothetical protein [Candidatus Sulfopaludibacter sp. SbA3]|nr:membrane hypothetical protein [Candidatus Sulfopaludibacter sp. SbA3]